METLKLTVEGMTCGHCKAAVTKALQGVPGVNQAEVDLGAKLATVTFDVSRTSFDQLKAAVEEEGYKVTAKA